MSLQKKNYQLYPIINSTPNDCRSLIKKIIDEYRIKSTNTVGPRFCEMLGQRKKFN